MAYSHATFRALARLAVRRFAEERCPQVAASLTFTTLLALVPLIAVGLTLLAAVPAAGELAARLQDFVVENLMPESVESVFAYAQQFARNAGRLTVAGLAALAVVSVMLLMTIENEFNLIWRVSRRRPRLQRALVYWTLITIGPVLVGASLWATSWLVSRSLGLVDELPALGTVLLRLVPFLLTVLALALLYAAMPNRRVRLGDAAVGGLVAGAAFELMKRGFGLYVAHVPSYQIVYGTFATFPIFLLWVYLSWLTVLSGAVLVAVLAQWRAGIAEDVRRPGGDFFAALSMLRELRAAHRAGTRCVESELAAAGRTTIDRAEQLLDTMAAAGWVARARPGDWLLAHDAAALQLAEVWRCFAVAPDAASPADADARRLQAAVEAAMGMTLEDWCAGSRGGEP